MYSQRWSSLSISITEGRDICRNNPHAVLGIYDILILEYIGGATKIDLGIYWSYTLTCYPLPLNSKGHFLSEEQKGFITSLTQLTKTTLFHHFLTGFPADFLIHIVQRTLRTVTIKIENIAPGETEEIIWKVEESNEVNTKHVHGKNGPIKTLIENLLPNSKIQVMMRDSSVSSKASTLGKFVSRYP